MSQACLLHPKVESVFEAAFLEARRHRWIESQNAGRDLGNQAFRDWYRLFWWTFIRYRHVEHLLGERRWREFDSASFGVIVSSPALSSPLSQEVVDLYRTGWENLNIIGHALQREYPMDAVLNCLVTINMNDARLNPQFQ